MVGKIYSNQKCGICGRSLKDNGKELSCPDHPGERASRFFVKFKTTFKRFGSYQEARRYLTGLQFKTDEGLYDPRDYRRDMPMSFTTLSNQWLYVKEHSKEKRRVNKSTMRNYRNYMSRAQGFFENTNIKAIRRDDIEKFLISLTDQISDKTRANIRDALHTFWVWCLNNGYIDMLPKDFPQVTYELTWRSITDKETQDRIIEECRRITEKYGLKTWFAIRCLATYVHVRPAELISITEGDIIQGERVIFLIHKTKEKKEKAIKLLPEDEAFVRSYPRALPHLHFFRHETSHTGVRAGEPFGKRYLWKIWNRACKNLGIEGLDLYGGTRHTSTVDLSTRFAPELVKSATAHGKSNRAFDRYVHGTRQDLEVVYASTRKEKPGEVVELKTKKEEK